MKSGDRFYHPGSWNTEPGWWEVTDPKVDCGVVRAKALTVEWEGESNWLADYVESAIGKAPPESA